MVLSGFALASLKYISPGFARAQDYLENQKPAIITGAWRGLFVAANIDYDKKIYIRTLTNPGPYELYGARAAFKVLPDSDLFAHKINEGKFMRIYVRAIQRANSQA